MLRLGCDNGGFATVGGCRRSPTGATISLNLYEPTFIYCAVQRGKEGQEQARSYPAPSHAFLQGVLDAIERGVDRRLDAPGSSYASEFLGRSRRILRPVAALALRPAFL